MHTQIASLAAVLRRHGAGRVLVTAHINPDGDAVGSVTACGLMLRGLGADVRVLLSPGVPDFLSWLPLPGPLVTAAAELEGWVPDLIVVLDCGDAARCEPGLAAFFLDGAVPAPGWERAETVNIDHHLGNPEFARHNLVVPDAAATGELVGRMAPELGCALEGALGRAVYLCLVSDTGNFSFANTTGSCLRMAAEIVENGLDVAAFSEVYENTWSLARMHLWGRLFEAVELHAGGRAASIVVPLEFLRAAGLGSDALEGFASWLRRLQGVEVGVFVREKPGGGAKVSLRSSGNIDVRALAARFGGGGHRAAAGIDMAVPVRDAHHAVLDALPEYMGAPPRQGL